MVVVKLQESYSLPLPQVRNRNTRVTSLTFDLSAINL